MISVMLPDRPSHIIFCFEQNIATLRNALRASFVGRIRIL
jgi:hypothetical protein